METPRSPLLMIFVLSNDIIDIFFRKLTTTGDADITRPSRGLFVLLSPPPSSLLPLIPGQSEHNPAPIIILGFKTNVGIYQSLN